MRYVLILFIGSVCMGQGGIMPGPGTVHSTVAPTIVGPADAYLDLSGTTNGTTITTGILNSASNTHGIVNTGNWTITGTAPVAATHTANMTLGGIVSVQGTQYATSNPSLGMTFSNAATLNFITLSIPTTGGASRGDVLFGFTPSFGAITGVMDIAVIVGSNGHKAVVQLSTANCAGSAGFDLEESVGSTITGCISATSGTSYFIAFDCDYASQNLHMNVYDSTFAQIGTTKTLTGIGFTAGETVATVLFGNNASGTTTGTNKFENLVVRWSGKPLFPIGPQNNTQDTVYWLAQSHANHGSGNTTTLATTNALDEHAGDLVSATCSNENASGAATSVTNTAGETFTKNTGSETTGNGQSMNTWSTRVSADHASQTYTCTWPTSQFSNIDVQIIRAQPLGNSTAPTFDVAAVANTTGSATSITSASFTPGTATGIDLAMCYIQAGTLMTSGTNYFQNHGSATDSTLVMTRTVAPSSSQTAACNFSSQTSSRMITVSNYKQ